MQGACAPADEREGSFKKGSLEAANKKHEGFYGAGQSAAIATLSSASPDTDTWIWCCLAKETR